MEWIKQAQQSWGYPGVAFLMFLENVFPPIPSELVMPLAGFMTAQGKLNFIGVVIAGTAGSVAGAVVLYYIGYFLGQERVCRWSERFGKYIALSPEDIARAGDWFDQHGAKVVFFCRMVPGVRSLISIPAGFAHMPLGRFLVYTTMGTAIWTAALAWAGRVLGNNFEKVEKYLGPAGSIVAAGLAVWFVVWLWRRAHSRESGKASAS